MPPKSPVVISFNGATIYINDVAALPATLAAIGFDATTPVRPPQPWSSSSSTRSAASNSSAEPAFFNIFEVKSDMGSQTSTESSGVGSQTTCCGSVSSGDHRDAVSCGMQTDISGDVIPEAMVTSKIGEAISGFVPIDKVEELFSSSQSRLRSVSEQRDMLLEKYAALSEKFMKSCPVQCESAVLEHDLQDPADASLEKPCERIRSWHDASVDTDEVTAVLDDHDELPKKSGDDKLCTGLSKKQMKKYAKKHFA
eukprot:TRINITY_DN5911_c1_g1_i4.p1 TRINITY_DN5911_c1_g1~~TRINITY_DN5911_c1_g1_i4.p1  ORF type:complete len:254 (+),score=46.11 TRINITY_DN5911_c1_g1_i4:86-847(+)